MILYPVRKGMSADEHSELSDVRHYDFQHGHRAESTELLDEAYHYARKAVAADPRDSDAHAALALILLLRQQHRAAIQECERAIAENPNSAVAHFRIAVLQFMIVNPDGLSTMPSGRFG